MPSKFINSIFLCMLFVLTFATKVVPDDDVFGDIGYGDDFVYDDDTGYEDNDDAYDLTGSEKDVRYDSDGYVTCECETSLDVDMTYVVDGKTLEMVYQNVSESVHMVQDMNFNLKFPDSNSCKTCKAVYIHCYDVDIPDCENRLIIFGADSRGQNGTNENIWQVIQLQSYQYTPKAIEIPIGQKNYRRQVRETGTCQFPSSLETAGVYCKLFPSFIKCYELCAFGYTLEEGIRRDMQCKHSENKWLPKGFKECKPFVDCIPSLISGGSLNCSTMSMHGPECKIECLPYEDKESVPEDTYTCDIDGHWDPPLPFCAYSNSGIMLVPAPKTKLHNDYYD